MQHLILEKDRFVFNKWLKTSSFFKINSYDNVIFFNNLNQIRKKFTINYFINDIIFFLKHDLNYLTISQLSALNKNLKRTFSKKISFLFLTPTYYNMFKKPAEVRMGNGKGQKINKQVYQLTYGSPFFQLRSMKKKSSLKFKKKLKGKLGLKSSFVNLNRFFFSS